MNEKQEIEMFGMTLEEVKKSHMFALKGNPDMDLMYAMQILSAAQHVMAMDLSSDNNETARQFINKAKFWISNVMEEMMQEGETE